MRLPDQILYSRLLLALSGGMFCAALAYFNWVQPLDRMFYDFFNEASPVPMADDIVIVSIDERSLLELGRWPWMREKHVELLRQLHSAGAAVVAMDILFAEHDAGYPRVDKLLAEAMKQHGAVVLPVFIGQADRGGRLKEMPPVEPIASAAAGLGHVHIEVDSDGVARSVYLREGVGSPRWPHFSVALGQLTGLEVGVLPGVIDHAVLSDPDPAAILRSNANLIPFMGPAGTVEQVSYVNVMRGRTNSDLLRDKIVFVGATAAGHADNITTSHGQISGVEINANIFHALRTGKLGRPVSETVSAWIVMAFTVISILSFTRLGPRNLLLAVLSSALVLPLLSFAVFHLWRLWISPAPVVLTLLVAYPLWNWLRLDAAVSFMQGQLVKLEKENRELSHEYGWEDVERAAEFLRALGHVAHWRWVCSGPTHTAAHADEQWRHTNAFSTRHFSLDGENRQLFLYWVSGHDHFLRTLPQIFPDDSAQGLTPGRGADFVRFNLAQLDLAYREARRNRALVRGTLEQLESGVILADFSGDVLLMNDQARDLLPQHEVNDNLLAVMQDVELTDAPAITDLLNTLILQGEHFSYEGRSRGTARDLLCQGGVIQLDRPLLLIVLTDVSELKQSEKRRVEALNFLSHDLRAPLTSVLALIESVGNEAPGPELLAQIEKYIQGNLSYAENFIQIAKIAHKGTPRFDECDAHSLVDNAVAQLFHAAKKRGITLRIHYGDEDIWLQCSRSLVERALINLVDNALKHSRDNCGIIIDLACDTDTAVFAVVDEGGGIDPRDMERIFEHFEQGAHTRSGAGLGLRFVSAVASTHSGSISVENNVTGGARFTLRIPLKPE